MAKSYYSLLGVPSNASNEEIKTAYRRLAKEYHPDHYSGDRRIFQDIHEAYCVLADPQKRREYKQECSLTRVRAPVNRSSYSGAEPLIPEEGPIYVHRARRGRRPHPDFESSPDILFDWILRHLM